MGSPPGKASWIIAAPMKKNFNDRILHVPRRFAEQEWGGTETVVLAISQEQRRCGARPEIYTTLALSQKTSETIGDIPVRRFDYCYPFLGLSREEKSVLDKKGGNLLSWSLLFALLTAKEVRLFHAHTLNRLGGAVLTAARLRNKPCVVTLHGGFFDLPPEQREDLLIPIQNKLEWGRLFGALLRSRRVLVDADLVICVGYSEYERAKAALPHNRVAYLPNGVNPVSFAQGDGVAYRRKHGLPERAFVVTNVSRIDAQKNQLLLLQAFARLRARRPESFLLLVGPMTQPDYALKLEAFIRENDLNQSVRLLPGLRFDDPDLVNAYHACDVFVLPSRHEPFGIVVLEAWSSGRAVVASRVGGLTALIRHEETGLLFDPAGAEAADVLAAQLECLAANPRLRSQLAFAGRQEARKRYAWPVIAGQLENLYRTAEENARQHR
jgi:glycosyltransferase involved in cell wall biosynthesis